MTDNHSIKKQIEDFLVDIGSFAAEVIVEYLYHDGYNFDLENVLLHIGQPAVDCLSRTINRYQIQSKDTSQLELILDRIEDCIEKPDNPDSNNRNHEVQISSTARFLDNISWEDFEDFIKSMYNDNGYMVESFETKDLGSDLIITKCGIERSLVLLKHLNLGQKVTKQAVQEAVAAKNYYQCSGAVVVSNQEFTQQASALAKSNDVYLIGREQLETMIDL